MWPWISDFLPTEPVWALLLAPWQTVPYATPALACPADMRLIEREHAETVERVCTKTLGGKCFAFDNAQVKKPPLAHVRTCMDLYEAPNRKGERPLVMVSGVEAERYCASKNKRLCREEEWESACEGDEARPWVYGYEQRSAVCNSGKGWRAFDAAALSSGGARATAEVSRLWQGEASGSRPQCVSQDGIFDLVGNVEEWVASRPGRVFRLALMGGFWAKPWTGCRGTNDAHEPGFRFYEVGFRCCQDPQ